MRTGELFECHCDHCINNTCTTDQLCYAEWRLVNYDELVAQPTNADLDHALPKLERTFNCYTKSNELPNLNWAICNQTASNTSHIIRRCCQTNKCNNETLLPTEQEALEEIRRFLPAAETDSSLYGQYSDLPLTAQIVLIVIIASLVLYVSVLINQAASSRKRQKTASESETEATSLPQPQQPAQPAQSQPTTNPRGTPLLSSSQIEYDKSIKRVLNNIINTITMRSHGVRPRSMSLPIVDSSPNISESRLGEPIAPVFPALLEEEDGASGNPDLNLSDTYSMASREPLIRNVQKPSPTETLNVLHANPNMNTDVFNGVRSATTQVTLGSGVRKDDDETSSGSGKGQAYLTQRSVSHDIQLKKIIGRGYFGVVWRAVFKDQPVAVKIFGVNAEASWERETEIYQTAMLRHKNILGLIATDKRHDTQTAGFWLVTDYYPLGSLFDFLQHHTIGLWDAVRMAFSITNGLSHLHVEIFGTRAKPAIAHRDIKSKNILVKNDGSCCIADLGMAARYNSTTGIVDIPANTRIGTRRYLAPEILSDELNLLDFEAVKATDIYSLGLVLWEILRRTCLVGSDQPDDMEMFLKRDAVEPPTSGSELYADNIPEGPWPPSGWTTGPPRKRPRTGVTVPTPQEREQATRRRYFRNLDREIQKMQAANREAERRAREEQALLPEKPIPKCRYGVGTTTDPVLQMCLGLIPPGPLPPELVEYYKNYTVPPGEPEVVPSLIPVEQDGQGILPADLQFINRNLPPEAEHLPPDQARPHQEAFRRQPRDLSRVPENLRPLLQEWNQTRVIEAPIPFTPVDPQSEEGQWQEPRQQLVEGIQRYNDRQSESHYRHLQRDYMSRAQEPQQTYPPQPPPPPQQQQQQQQYDQPSTQPPQGSQQSSREDVRQAPQQTPPAQQQAQPQFQVPLRPAQTRPSPQPGPSGRNLAEEERARRQREMMHESMESLDERTSVLASVVDVFEVPYQNEVSADPTAAEMYEVVCLRKIRPRLSPRWLHFASMRDFATLMTECWYEKPQARLSALRLRKSFSELAYRHFNLDIQEYES